MIAMLLIVMTRLEALKAAIVSRDWDSVEFQFDRVLRGTTKALDSARRGER